MLLTMNRYKNKLEPLFPPPPILLTIRIRDKSILCTISYIHPPFFFLTFGKITYNSYSF